MAQQLNLLDPSQPRQRDLLTAGSALLLVGTMLAGSAVLAAALQWQTGRTASAAAQPAADDATAVAAAAALAASAAGPVEAEVRRLRELERHQQQLRAALASGAAGAPDGYTPYLKALARQAQSSLWITGFAVAAEGDAIELEGRMVDASVLPAYLRRLNAESRFSGRPFAQLQLRAVAGTNDTNWTEFAMRSAPGGQAGGKP